MKMQDEYPPETYLFKFISVPLKLRSKYVNFGDEEVEYFVTASHTMVTTEVCIDWLVLMNALLTMNSFTDKIKQSCDVVLTFESVEEILKCDHSYESY